jgi:DNA-3-methyladenine glycosylase
LLNKVLRVTDDAGVVRAGRIVEVEAYDQTEEASHTFRGLTKRNSVMFGPAGRLYVYFSYGVHWCANIVCEPEGVGAAVLLRALRPLAGLEAMVAARPRAKRERDLCSGPGKLTEALGIGPGHNGADLVTGEAGVVLLDDGVAPPPDAVQTTRVGITRAVDLPWRWYVAGEPNVSRR